METHKKHTQKADQISFEGYSSANIVQDSIMFCAAGLDSSPQQGDTPEVIIPLGGYFQHTSAPPISYT